jgi:ElaA protein
MHYTTEVKPFHELSAGALYNILRLRNEVFVVEQQCPYQDADNKDQKCHHLMLYKEKTFAAYARLVPPGISYDAMSIGRVLTAPAFRGTGMGRRLMEEAMEHCYKIFGKGSIKISAQEYLKDFYNTFGFTESGAVYDEDGIPHLLMIKKQHH